MEDQEQKNENNSILVDAGVGSLDIVPRPHPRNKKKPLLVIVSLCVMLVLGVIIFFVANSSNDQSNISGGITVIDDFVEKLAVKEYKEAEKLSGDESILSKATLYEGSLFNFVGYDVDWATCHSTNEIAFSDEDFSSVDNLEQIAYINYMCSSHDSDEVKIEFEIREVTMEVWKVYNMMRSQHEGV